MKRFLIFVVILATAFGVSLFAQDEPLKVDREKHTRMGIRISGGPAWVSATDKIDCDQGLEFGAYYALTAAMKPSDIEFPWFFNFGVGFEYTGGKMTYGKRKNEGTYTIVDLFPMYFGADYVFNPLSTSSKFKLYGDLRCSFLTIGIPTSKTGKHSNGSTFDSVESATIGINVGAEFGIKYAFKKFEIAIGGVAGVGSPYSYKYSGGMTYYGAKASLYYFFK